MSGFTTCIKVPASPVAVTGELMHLVGADSWQITDFSRRVLSDVNPRVKVGAAYANPLDYELSVLTGVVKFHANQPAVGAAVKFVGKYLPMVHIGGANKYTLNSESTTEDVTAFEDVDKVLLPPNSVPNKVFAVGSSEVKVTFERIIRENKALYLKAMLARKKVMLYLVDDGANVTVGWFMPTQDNFNGANQISRESVNFVLQGDIEFIAAHLGLEGAPAEFALDTLYGFQPIVVGSTANVSFSAQNLPAWASIDADTGLVSGTPTGGDEAESTNIIITVTQGAESVDLGPLILKKK